MIVVIETIIPMWVCSYNYWINIKILNYTYYVSTIVNMKIITQNKMWLGQQKQDMVVEA